MTFPRQSSLGQLEMQFSPSDEAYAVDARRRRLIVGASACVAATICRLGQAAAEQAPVERTLVFQNLHTGERTETCYWQNGAYLQEGLRDIARVLRDHRTGDIYPIDPALLDALDRLCGALEARRTFQVISGYRSPRSNALLASASSGVAKKSMHMEGRAIDLRIPGIPLHVVRDAAKSLKAGGVGYYPKSDFVHVDTGRVRYW